MVEISLGSSLRSPVRLLRLLAMQSTTLLTSAWIEAHCWSVSEKTFWFQWWKYPLVRLCSTHFTSCASKQCGIWLCWPRRDTRGSVLLSWTVVHWHGGHLGKEIFASGGAAHFLGDGSHQISGVFQTVSCKIEERSNIFSFKKIRYVSWFILKNSFMPSCLLMIPWIDSILPLQVAYPVDLLLTLGQWWTFSLSI